MSRTAYVHIGMPKAASKSIQNALGGYSGPSVRYADLGDTNHSILLHTLFRQTGKPHGSHRRSARSSEWVDDRKAKWGAEFDRVMAEDQRDVILSGEVLVSFSASEVKALKARLMQFVDQVQIIGYIRRPVEFCGSQFQQAMKNGQSEFTVTAPNYTRMFSDYVDVFGRDQVAVTLLSPEALTGGDPVVDFSGKVGVDSGELTITRSNESMCAEMVAMLFVWNRDGFRHPGSVQQQQAMRMLLREYRQVKGQKFRMPKALVYEAMDPAPVAWLQDTFGIDCTEPDTVGPNTIEIGSEVELDALAGASGHLLDPLLQKEGLGVPSHASSTVKLNALFAKALTDRHMRRRKVSKRRGRDKP